MTRFVDIRLPVRLVEGTVAQLVAVLAAELGGEVSVLGGGTRTSEEGEPLGSYVNLLVPDDGDALVDQAAEIAGAWASRGSYVSVDGSPAREFGAAQGLAIYFNGTDLPDEVYASSDTDELVDRLSEAIGRAGYLAGHWNGPRETAVYFYGRAFDEMAGAVAPILASDVVDAGTQLDRDRRIESCDVNLGVPRARAEEAFDLIAAMLPGLGALRGSTVSLFSNEILPVGSLEGLVLRVPLVDGADFEDEFHVQHSWALDALRDRVLTALGTPNAVPSWQIHQGSDLYLSVPAVEPARRALAPMLALDPLLLGATLATSA